MTALHYAWRIICQLIAQSSGPSCGEQANARANTVQGGDDEQREPMHAHSGWLSEILDRPGKQLREAQRQDELAERSSRRALTLLIGVMNSEQREEFLKFRHFHVVGGHSGGRYRIREAALCNVDLLRADGTVAYRLCAYPAGCVPVYDVLAAQILHLQDSVTEQRFLQEAITYPATPSARAHA